jgi:flagellar basal-body rod modification protein FlgD
MSNQITGASHAYAKAGASDASTPKNTDPTVSKEMFLQLLVAQVKNQNPLNPADGVEFLTQLAQFTELEQLIDMRQDLAAIRTELSNSTASQGGQS